jgi:CRISPR-associated protein Cas5d
MQRNGISYRLWGKHALFTDPVSHLGGEKCSYHIPTYEALRGITESIYWKPTLEWIVDRLRVVRQIKTVSKGVKPMSYFGGNSLAMYTYLADVEYQVEAHFIWNEAQPQLAEDRDENKHHNIAKRMLERGGRRDIFLGARECQSYVEPVVFGAGAGAYDAVPELAYPIMFHGFDYATPTDQNLYARFWTPVMRNGVIAFCAPSECPVRNRVRAMAYEACRSSGWKEKGLCDELDA